MSYHYSVLDWIKAKNIESFTHKDISRITNANCSYSVLRNLKKGLLKEGKEISEKEEKSTKEVYDPVKKKKIKVTKRYMRYFIENIA